MFHKWDDSESMFDALRQLQESPDPLHTSEYDPSDGPDDAGCPPASGGLDGTEAAQVCETWVLGASEELAAEFAAALRLGPVHTEPVPSYAGHRVFVIVREHRSRDMMEYYAAAGIRREARAGAREWYVGFKTPERFFVWRL